MSGSSRTSEAEDVEALRLENACLRAQLAQAAQAAVAQSPAAASDIAAVLSSVRHEPYARGRTVAVTATLAGAAATPVLDSLFHGDAARDSAAAAVAAAAAAVPVPGDAWQETCVLDVPKEDWWVLVPRPGDTPTAAATTSNTSTQGTFTTSGTTAQILGELERAAAAAPALSPTSTAALSAGAATGADAGNSGGDCCGDFSAGSGLGPGSDSYVVVDDRELRESLARFILETLQSLPETRGLGEEEVRTALHLALAQASHGDQQNGVLSSTFSWWRSLTQIWGWAAVSYRIYKNPVCNQYMLTWAYKTMSWALFLVL